MPKDKKEAGLHVEPRHNKFAVVDNQTELVWRTLDTRDEAEKWAKAAERPSPSRR